MTNTIPTIVGRFRLVPSDTKDGLVYVYLRDGIGAPFVGSLFRHGSGDAARYSARRSVRCRVHIRHRVGTDPVRTFDRGVHALSDALDYMGEASLCGECYQPATLHG